MIELSDPRVWLGDGDGWTELSGITRITIEEKHAMQPVAPPPDDPLSVLHRDCAEGPHYGPPDLIVGYGTGDMRGILAWLNEPPGPPSIERALDILRPLLAREPLYRPTRTCNRASTVRAER
ncbi:hypothetical protein ABZ070_10180 [Streptomyces sp. NPDC006283]|uniref:hypothetical protein n=1 Tax=Streptomyces sp. NPDC006283 TaxID=3156741 RepID=UPI0033A53F8B